MTFNVRQTISTAGLASILAWCSATAQSNEDAIRTFEAQQETSWNAHDAKAYTDCFAADADLVNVLGWWWKSRAEALEKLTGAFSTVFSKTHLHFDSVSIRLLSSEIAVAHVVWSMTGALSPDGSGSNIPQKGIQTQVLQKRDSGWTIVSFQNTNAVPERPFPTA